MGKKRWRNSAPFDLAQQTTYNSILWSLCFNNVQKLWQNSSYTTFLYVGKQNSIIPREQLCCEGALTLVCNNSVAFTSQKGTNLPSKDKATLLYDIANFLLEFHYGRRGKPKTWGMVVVVNGSKHFIFFMIRRFFWTRAMTERTLTIPHV